MDINYYTYLSNVVRAWNRDPHLRHGQAAFNVLHEMRDDLSVEVRVKGLDPFYLPDDDPRIDDFYQFICENW